MSEAEQIAAFIRDRGITRLPAGVAAPTSARIPPEAAAFHAARGLDPIGDAWRAKKTGGGWAAYWARRKAAKAAVP